MTQKQISIRPYPAYITASKDINSPLVKEKLTIDLFTDVMMKGGKARRELEQQIASMTGRAVMGLVNACAEWMLCRIDAATVYPDICYYAEAMWPRTLDLKYIKKWERWVHEDKMGKDKSGAIAVIHDIVEEFLWLTGTDVTLPATNSTASFIYLTRYVVPDTRAFNKWLATVMERLMKLYPRTTKYNMFDNLGMTYEDWKCPECNLFNESLRGLPVPREAYDPDFDFTIEMTEELTNKMLGEMKNAGNPYLRTSEEMLAEGFTGTPYHWETKNFVGNNFQKEHFLAVKERIKKRK